VLKIDDEQIIGRRGVIDYEEEAVHQVPIGDGQKVAE